MINTPLLDRAGGQRQCLMLAIELQKLGHEVEIFTSAADETSYPELFCKLKINVVPFEPKYPKPLDQMFKKYRVFFKDYTSTVPSMSVLGGGIPKGFDLINNHNFPTEWAAFFAKRRLKIPIVWMCNEPPFWLWHPEQRQGLEQFNWPVYELFDKFVVTQVDEILSLSWSAADTIRKTYGRFSKVVRSGVDVEFFHKASGRQIRQKYGIDDDDFVLLQVGALLYYKRQVDSVKALARLSKKYANVKLILDGIGDPEPIKALSRGLGVEDKLFFSNASSDKELAQVYSACDSFVFPSENTWGLAVTEAMAAGKPVVVSNKAGASEIIQNNVNGFVFNHKRPVEIAANVEMMINDRKLCDRIGNNCYNYVKQNLSWEKYAESVEAVFRRTLNPP